MSTPLLVIVCLVLVVIVVLVIQALSVETDSSELSSSLPNSDSSDISSQSWDTNSSTLSHPPGGQHPRWPSSEPNPHRAHILDAKKTLRVFEFILKSFDQAPLWRTPTQRADYVHDLALMLDEEDICSASLELLGADRTVLFRHTVQFLGTQEPARPDAAQGIELPILAADRIAGYRILVAPASRIDEYQHRLRRRWTSAQRLAERTGSRFSSEHTRHINAHRMAGEFFIADDARRTATIFHVSPAGDYAFASDPAFPVRIYLHKAFCETPFSFLPGVRISFVPIQTPRGIQARCARPA